jgi:hypothetical protein
MGTEPGLWITLSKPKFSGTLGKNKDKQYMYTLGQMSFDMFRPSDLAMSIQGMFNPVHNVSGKQVQESDHVPKGLKDELLKDQCVLRTYEYVVVQHVFCCSAIIHAMFERTNNR